MPTERAPTPQSHTAISMSNSSEDRISERSDSIATVEIFRSDGSPVSGSLAPSENTENTECGNVTRHRLPNAEESKRFVTSDVPEIDLERKRTSGISKGVILNAMNFGSYDLKCTSNDIKEKPESKDHEMNENGSVPKDLEAAASSEKAAEAEKSEEKKEMSLKRKIAFGCSFLPSIMFVLTFAVILPCEDYKPGGRCVKNRWSLMLNQTDITSFLSLPQSLLVGYQFANSTASSDSVMNLNEETGRKVWEIPLDSVSESFDCENIDVNGDSVEDCLTVLQNGNVCAFNLSDGYRFWTFDSTQPKDDTVLLSGCRPYKGSKPIAIASYSKENALSIDVISETDGSVLVPTRTVKLNKKCITFSMKAWKHDNEMDLIYFCEDAEGFGYIELITQNMMCPSVADEGATIIPEGPLIKFSQNQNDVLYLPTTEGLFLWAGEEIKFLELDGSTVRWQDSISYYPQNRIAEVGNFYIGGEQIVLIGQNASSGVVVSVLASHNGKEISTSSIPERTLKQAVLIPGNETSSILVSVLKVKVTETEEVSDKNVVLLSNVSSASDFRTDAPYKVNGKLSITEELILLQFEGKNTTHVVLEDEIPVTCKKEGVCESEYPSTRIISAFSEEAEEDSMNLKIVTLKVSDDQQRQNGSKFFSQLTALGITHQHNPTNGETSCKL